MLMSPTGDNHFTWSSEPGEGLAILQGKLGSTFIYYDHEYWSDSKNQSHDHLLYSLGLY